MVTARPPTIGRETFMPFLRPPYFRAEVLLAGLRDTLTAGRPDPDWVTTDPPVFLIGCGRSGTTILGQLLGRHPAIDHRHEPYAAWAAIDPRTDFLHAYTSTAGRALLDWGDATARERRRFATILRPAPGRRLLEKTPINALRVGYLQALAPGATFVHLVRDGVEVSRSIAAVAANTVRYAGRGTFNRWWGVEDAKWRCLTRDAAAAGHPVADGLVDDLQRGAYEWLVSLGEVDRHRRELDGHLVEVRYDQLTAEPERVLADLGRHLGLDGPERWAAEAGPLLHRGPAARSDGPALVLPARLASRFNEANASLGFAGRAAFAARDDGPFAS